MSDKMQTLRCQHGDGHDWERPAQRGKPPRYCPDHRPAAEAPRAPRAKSTGSGDSPGRSDAGTDAANSTGGDSATVNPFIAKAQQAAARKRMAELRDRKAEVAAERVEAERKLAAEESKTLDERIEQASQIYSEFLEKAVAIETTGDEFDKAWNRADQAQNSLLGMLRRKTHLAKVAGKSDSELVADVAVVADAGESIEATGAHQYHDAELSEGIDESVPDSEDFASVIESELG